MSRPSPAAVLPPAAGLTPQQARWYAATQPFIIDKTPLFARAAEAVFAVSAATRQVTEIGIGPGGFLAQAVARGWLQPEDRLLGLDLSAAMVAEAHRALAAQGWPTASLTAEALDSSPLPPSYALLVSGLNALAIEDPQLNRLLPPASQDVLILSQVEHYAPNTPSSPLARRLTAIGWPWVDKAKWRRWLVSRLKPHGWLVVIDDYAAPDEEENERWLTAWDAHVARQWARPEVIAQLSATDPAAAARLAQHHAPTRPWAERLTLVRRVREWRRRRTAEEVQPLAEARADWENLFGPEHAWIIPHPHQEAFPQFFLLLGQKHEAISPLGSPDLPPAG